MIYLFTFYLKREKLIIFNFAMHNLIIHLLSQKGRVNKVLIYNI